MNPDFKRKGFTLIEMLAVMILLIVIFTLSFPSITAMIKGSNNKISDAKRIFIISSAKDYFSDNKDLYRQNEYNKYCITMNDLVNNGNIDEKYIEDEATSDLKIEVTFDKQKSNYEIVDECTEQVRDYTLYLNGEDEIEINVGEGGQYYEYGIVARDNNDNDVSSTLEKIIYDSNNNILNYVDTTKVDVYTVRYTVIIDDIKRTIERYVNVVDKEEPVITLLNPSVTINNTDLEYNIYEGFSATDNYDTNLKVRVSSNLSLTMTGKYYIKYIVTDNSGNTATAQREVTIEKEKDIRLTYDADSDNEADIGDIITVKSTENTNEEFYVISNDGTNINALAKYNLKVGNIYQYYQSSGEEITEIDSNEEGYGLQNEEMKGNVSGQSVRKGVTAFSLYSFSSVENAYEESILKVYVDAYKNKLSNNVLSARLITKEEIEQLANNGNSLSNGNSIKSKADALNRSWIYSTSYWSSSASGFACSVWAVSIDAFTNIQSCGGDRYYGVRPVITISKSEI